MNPLHLHEFGLLLSFDILFIAPDHVARILPRLSSFRANYPEKSRITNSIFLAILDIEGFPFFLGNV